MSGASATVSSGAALLRRMRQSFVRALVVAFFLAMGCNLLGLLVPLYSMELYNLVLNTRDVATLEWLSVGLAFAMLVYGALEFVRARLHDAMVGRAAGSLSLPALLAALRAGDIGGKPHGNQPPAGQTIRDLGELRDFLSGHAIMAPLDLVWSPLLLAVLFLMHWGYGAYAVLCALLLLVFGLAGDALTRRPLETANDDTMRAFAEVSVALRHAEAVHGLGMLPALARKWRRSQDRMLTTLHDATRTTKIVTSATKACRLLMTGGMVALGLVLCIKGEVSGGSMVATNMILAKLLLPFEQLVSTWRHWVLAGGAWRRLAALIGETPSARGTLPLPCHNGQLVVERLVYIPPGGERPALRGVSFAVEPGQVLGVIGPSGAGKSTLARLVVGAVEPSSGGVWLDGHSTWHWERGDFGRYIGYVPQATTLFEGSVADNIARLRDAEPRQIVEAARRVGLHEAIMRLPNGYATEVGDAGFVLSGGQRQRLALARALFGGPRLLVLDEPNASLDEAGETALLEAVAAARDTGAAVLMIAHRPSLLAIADKLLVLKDGLVDRFGARESVLQALNAPPVQLVRAKDREASGAAPLRIAAR